MRLDLKGQVSPFHVFALFTLHRSDFDLKLMPTCGSLDKHKQYTRTSLIPEAGPAPASPTAPEEDSVQFNKLSYLGCTWVKAPRNEAEAQRAMATLRAESAIPIPITLHVPSGPDGSVRSVTQ